MNKLLYCIDLCLTLWRLGSKKHFNISSPHRVLISNIAQLGDVIMMTSLLPVLKRALPHVKIGVIVGSWAEPIVREHPLIDHIHLLDHWKVARSEQKFLHKWKRYVRMARTALQQMKQIQYDVAIECCYYFPSTMPLTYRAGIPTRIGYTSGGFGPLLTHPVQWTNRLQSAAEYFADLLALVTPIHRSLLKPTLPPLSARPPILPSKSYLVIHMGSGNPIKEWPLENWRLLSQRLIAKGHQLAFTGKGKKEADDISTVLRDLPQCIDLSNRLSWAECMGFIKGAKILVGVDTSTGHVAAATETPSVLIYCGINPIQHWSPINPKAHILIHSMPCYPCYMNNGCKTMDCIRKVSVETVYQKIQSLLESSASPI